MIKQIKTWLKYNPPKSATVDEWNDHKIAFKKNAPFRHAINKFNTKLGTLKIKMSVIKWWILHRTTHRYHIIKTGLTPDYHDIDTLMLHGNFNLLVDYVEIQLASNNLSASYEYNIPFFKGLKYKFSNWRSREHGLDHLQWEKTLTEESPQQAERAIAVEKLYLWWKDIRPARVEVEYAKHPNAEKFGFMGVLSEKYQTEYPDEYNAWSASAKASINQEDAWYDEDTEMLIELMKIRRGLWT